MKLATYKISFTKNGETKTTTVEDYAGSNGERNAVGYASKKVNAAAGSRVKVEIVKTYRG